MVTRSTGGVAATRRLSEMVLRGTYGVVSARRLSAAIPASMGW